MIRIAIVTPKLISYNMATDRAEQTNFAELNMKGKRNLIKTQMTINKNRTTLSFIYKIEQLYVKRGLLKLYKVKVKGSPPKPVMRLSADQ